MDKPRQNKKAYRPICLLNSVEKRYEYLIDNRLKKEINGRPFGRTVWFRGGTVNGRRTRECQTKNGRFIIKKNHKNMHDGHS